MNRPLPSSTPATCIAPKTADSNGVCTLSPTDGDPTVDVETADSIWEGYRWCAKKLATISATPAVRNVVLSMFDQTIVSGTSFLTTIMIGRVCGAEELGIYSLAFTFVVLATNLQTAVFTTPYTIYATRLPRSERREYAGTVLMHCVILMAAATTLLVLAGFGWMLLGTKSPLSPVIWMLAAAMPLLLLREFVRRFAFAHLQILSVLALDVALAVIQIGGLMILLLNGWLSAFSVYLVMGMACAIAGGVTLLLMKADFSVGLARVIPELKRSWLLGRWIVASRVTALFQTYAVYWLLALLVSTAQTGIYSASMVVLLAANPFVIGIGNILEPRAAQAMAEGGVRELSRVVWKATLLLGGVMGLYCVLVVFAGGSIVAWLYQGSEYANQGPTVAVLALAALVNAWETGAVHGLRVLERPDLSFRGGFLSLGITLVVGILLVRPLGTLGAACAILAGDAAAATVRWIAYSRLSKPDVG